MESQSLINRRAPHERWKKTKAEFVDMTTLHGLRRAGDQTGQISTFRRYIWAFFIAIGLGAIIVITFDQIRNYWRHPTTTKTTIMYTQEPLAFPAVTICSLNRFYDYDNSVTKEDLLTIDAYDIAELSFSHDIPFGALAEEFLNKITKGMNSTEKKSFFENFTNCDRSIINRIENGKGKQRLKALLHINCTKKHEKPEDMKRIFKKYGFNISLSLVSCKFGNGRTRQCSADDFDPVYSTKYGLCWTFNREKKNYAIWQQTHGGIPGGLRMEIINPQRLFLTRKIQTAPLGAGLKITLHHPNEPADVDGSGFFVGPGFHSFAEVELTREEYVKPPWGHCVHEKDRDYTKTEAEQRCYQNLSKKHCRCTPPSYIVDKSNNICNGSSLALCMYDVKWMPDTNMSISNNINTEVITKSWQKCSQQPSCKASKYKTALSSVVWPSLPDVHLYEKELNMTKEMISSDFQVLDIYYPEMKYINVKEVTLIYFTNLLSKFGGTMGLFLGASILTMMELIEVMLLYCRRHVETTTNTIKEWKSGSNFGSTTNLLRDDTSSSGMDRETTTN
ncbi:acid-sensing ion channel 1-like [Styela clava]